MKSCYRKYAALLLSAVTAVLSCLPAYADEIVLAGGGTVIPTEETIIGEGGYGYTPERWAQLNDNVMEYDEIADLVHNFNTTITTIWDNLEDTQNELQKSITEIESQQRKMKDLKDRAENEGNITDQVTYATQEAIFKGVASALRPTASSLLVSKTTRASINKAEEQITQVVQSLMIAYDSIRKQNETLTALEEMYEAQYKLLSDEYSLGMATENEVLQAQNNVLSAQSTILSLQSSLSSLLPTLCTLTGWPAGAQPVIASIPEVDVNRIYEMNLEEDTIKAIGNNSTLISQRTSEHGTTYDGISARLGWINEGEEKLTIIMQELYNDVLSKKTAYDAAKTGWEAAQMNQDGYRRMYDMGMLSRADYLGTMVSYYQEKAAYESTDTALLLAIETYNWAVLGLVEVE